MKDWKSEVTEEMLTPAHRKLADVIGMEATLKLCEVFGGEAVYIPLTDNVYAAVRRKWIRDEYLERNVAPRHIARKYGLSEREVQRIISEIRPTQIDISSFIEE